MCSDGDKSHITFGVRALSRSLPTAVTEAVSGTQKKLETEPTDDLWGNEDSTDDKMVKRVAYHPSLTFKSLGTGPEFKCTLLGKNKDKAAQQVRGETTGVKHYCWLLKCHIYLR